jgi:hypothetical protein
MEDPTLAYIVGILVIFLELIRILSAMRSYPDFLSSLLNTYMQFGHVTTPMQLLDMFPRTESSISVLKRFDMASLVNFLLIVAYPCFMNLFSNLLGNPGYCKYLGIHICVTIVGLAENILVMKLSGEMKDIVRGTRFNDREAVLQIYLDFMEYFRTIKWHGLLLMISLMVPSMNAGLLRMKSNLHNQIRWIYYVNGIISIASILAKGSFDELRCLAVYAELSITMAILWSIQFKVPSKNVSFQDFKVKIS